MPKEKAPASIKFREEAVCQVLVKVGAALSGSGQSQLYAELTNLADKSTLEATSVCTPVCSPCVLLLNLHTVWLACKVQY